MRVPSTAIVTHRRLRPTRSTKIPNNGDAIADIRYGKLGGGVCESTNSADPHATPRELEGGSPIHKVRLNGIKLVLALEEHPAHLQQEKKRCYIPFSLGNNESDMLTVLHLQKEAFGLGETPDVALYCVFSLRLFPTNKIFQCLSVGRAEMSQIKDLM